MKASAGGVATDPVWSAVPSGREPESANRTRRFDDFHLIGADGPEWQQCYQQLSPGRMQSRLAAAARDGTWLFRKWMSERVVQQGCVPRGQICFALPLDDAGGVPRMQGREMAADSLFLLRGGDEFALQRPPGMTLLALSFDLEDWRRRLDERPLASALPRGPSLRVSADALQRLRRDLLAGLHGDASVHGLFAVLAEALDGAAPARQGAGSAAASYVVAECQRLVAASAGSPPSIEALCARLRTSRRSLQNSFRQVAGTTPVEHLRALRLNVVRRRLLSTHPAELGIAQAAEEAGFEQLSHFARRYRTLFGELPSATPRRQSNS